MDNPDIIMPHILFWYAFYGFECLKVKAVRFKMFQLPYIQPSSKSILKTFVEGAIFTLKKCLAIKKVIRCFKYQLAVSFFRAKAFSFASKKLL
jgi:hypothetical protein